MNVVENIYYPTNEFEKIFLKNIWRLTDSTLNSRKEIILPKGTVEVIFNYSENINYYSPLTQAQMKLPNVFVNGLNFKPFELYKIGRQVFVGIQLNCISLKQLFNISPKELHNNVYNGRLICSELERLSDQLFIYNEFEKQVEIILCWLRKKIAGIQLHTYLKRGIRLNNFDYRQLTVRKMSEEIFISERQLRRFSQDWLGMRTDDFIQYNKYITSLNLLHNSNDSLTEIGLNAGYYDQSHFIREFKGFTDLTPKQYRDAKRGVPGHIFQ
ncbi:MAG: helix-turn-helix transcriptional regulator [Saprospiraceae bacterium]|nr:helix-turn-helix transcriptional regulator [Saprospiraceae bacterium]